MTIGIAAYGPHAGLAVIRALAAVESVARGAIGGFVSFAAIPKTGDVLRASVQHGGSVGLFGPHAEAMPNAMANAEMAGLMSSGPDRPEPLSQFVPAAHGVGLVTGHRMPNTIGRSGLTLNEEVLGLMADGLAPAEAILQVVDANPDSDAGMVGLSMTGELFLADTPYVEERGDRGRQLLRSPSGACVAVLHNAIEPHRPIASLAASIALDVMDPIDRQDGFIHFHKGIELNLGSQTHVNIDPDGTAVSIVVRDPKFLSGEWSMGLGHHTLLMHQTKPKAIMLYEPYMVVRNGRLLSIDGRDEIQVPFQTLAQTKI